MIVGDIYKITGGKWKKMKQGTLQKINDTYSDVSIAGADPIKDAPKMVKVKNCYLHAINENVIEMPEAKDLLIVPDTEEGQAKMDSFMGLEHPIPLEAHPQSTIDALVKELQNPDPLPQGVLEISTDGVEPYVVDNITDVLPTVDEALQLRNDVKHLKEELSLTKAELVSAMHAVPEPEVVMKTQVETVVENPFTENQLTEIIKSFLTK